MKGIQGSRCPRRSDISQRTNQARRGSRKRPGPPGVGARRAETCHDAPSPDGRHDQLINAAHWRSVRWRGRPRTLTRDKESPGRAGAFQ